MDGYFRGLGRISKIGNTFATQNAGSLAAADKLGGQEKVKLIYQPGSEKGSVNFGAAFN